MTSIVRPSSVTLVLLGLLVSVVLCAPRVLSSDRVVFEVVEALLVTGAVDSPVICAPSSEQDRSTLKALKGIPAP